MNRFIILQEFVKEIQAQFGQNSKGSRVMKTTQTGPDGKLQSEDERYEILMFLRIFFKDSIIDDQELLTKARVAHKSALRAYTVNKLFSIKELNLTNYARIFGLYKDTTRLPGAGGGE